MTFADLARRASKFAIDNSPSILTTIGVAGTLTTAYLAGKASFQAADIIRIKEGDDEERGVIQGSPKEILRSRLELVWPLYVPPVAMGAATIVCIVGANKIGASRAAGLAAGYTIMEKGFEEYKAKVVDKLGERKEEAIRDEILQDRVNDSYTDMIEMRGLATGQVCYEIFGGQYFRTTVEEIRAAENSINNVINHDGYASLADFYRCLDLDTPTFSENIGWNSDKLIEVQVGSTIMHETEACLTLSFRHDPLPDYGRFH